MSFGSNSYGSVAYGGNVLISSVVFEEEGVKLDVILRPTVKLDVILRPTVKLDIITRQANKLNIILR